jgi:hypothetical protein
VTGRDLRDAVDAVLSGRGGSGPASEPRLQHQVEVRQRPGYA